MADAGGLHSFVDLTLNLLLGDALGPGYKGQVLPGGAVQIQGRLLRQIADEPLGLLGVLEDVIPSDGHLPRGGGQAAGHDVHGGGLARSVGAEKAIDLPFFHREGQIGYGGMIAVPFCQVLDLDQ